MPPVLNLYGTDSDLSTVAGDAGMLCEVPRDSQWLKGAEHCYGPEELLGSADEALVVAHSLVGKLIAALSAVKGLPVLTMFEEPLLEQVSYAVQALHLDRWICSQQFSECRFDCYSPWLNRLQEARRLNQSDYRFTGDATLTRSKWMRQGVSQLWRSRNRPADLFRRAAPQVSRYSSASRMRGLAEQAPRGGIWFYSTAYNYTKAGLAYEDYFPAPVRFLVEDPNTGGKCLSERNRSFYPLYAWSRASDIASRLEVRAIAQRIDEEVRAVPLSGDEDRLRSVLLNSDWWDHFLKRRLQFVIFHERVLQRWCEAVQPEMLVVGNAGWERALLQSPQAKDIPSVMLQHGVMHWVYGVADQPVTTFLLRGEFFRRVINPRLRSKSIICNYDQHEEASSESGGERSDVLFITTPYDVPALFHPAELREVLGRVMSVCESCRRRLLIRVHPVENIGFYQRLVNELQRAGKQVEVLYSQGPGVDGALRRCCVAILHFSTMFIDCLRQGIPIISFDWHWFPNKRHYAEEKIFNLASSLADLEELLRKGIAGQLRSRRDGLETFSAPTKPEEVSRVLLDFWHSRVQASDRMGQRSLAHSAD